MCCEHERQAAADDGRLPRLDAGRDAFEVHGCIAVAKQLHIEVLGNLQARGGFDNTSQHYFAGSPDTRVGALATESVCQSFEMTPR